MPKHVSCLLLSSSFQIHCFPPAAVLVPVGHVAAAVVVAVLESIFACSLTDHT